MRKIINGVLCRRVFVASYFNKALNRVIYARNYGKKAFVLWVPV
jgi:hypothetical protein